MEETWWASLPVWKWAVVVAVVVIVVWMVAT